MERSTDRKHTRQEHTRIVLARTYVAALRGDGAARVVIPGVAVAIGTAADSDRGAIQTRTAMVGSTPTAAAGTATRAAAESHPTGVVRSVCCNWQAVGGAVVRG